MEPEEIQFITWYELKIHPIIVTALHFETEVLTQIQSLN